MIKPVVLDIELVKRSQNGDLKAFEMLVVKYQFRIAGLLSRYTNRHADIEDMSQEVFIKAYRALGSFRGDSEFYTWLYRIAINTAKNHLSQKARRKDEYEFDYQDNERSSVVLSKLVDNNTPDSIIAGQQLLDILHNTIEKMPNDLKQAILLREIDGLSYTQIAKVMACPVGTVRSRLFRAREILDLVVNQFMVEGKLK